MDDGNGGTSNEPELKARRAETGSRGSSKYRAGSSRARNLQATAGHVLYDRN